MMRNIFENSNEMIDNLSNEMEESKNKKLGLYESRTFGRISYGFVRDDKGMVYNEANTNIDVIHWNTGLWDCLRLFEEEPHTPIEVYAYYIDRICIRIRKFCPNAKVIFATSTSVLSEEMGKDFKRYNEEIEAYNKAAVEVVKKYGFEVNDLYAVSTTLPKEAHSDPVHYYTKTGTEAFTNKVLSVVTPYLDIDEALEYVEEMYTDKPIGI